MQADFTSNSSLCLKGAALEESGQAGLLVPAVLHNDALMVFNKPNTT